MADVVMDSAVEMDKIIPEVWSSRYYDALLVDLVFNSIIAKDYEGEIQDLGDTVNIASFPEFAAADELAEEAAQDADGITITSQQLVINKMVVKDFIVTKKAMLQSQPHMDKLRELAVFAVLKKIQALIIAAIVPSAAAPDHQIGYTSGTTLALADILAAKELLDLQNVPAGDRYLVFGAAQANDVFAITGFTSSDYLLAGAPLATGEVPSALVGFQPKMTNAQTANVSTFFHKSFMTMASQQGMNVAVYDQAGIAGKRQTRVNVDTLFGLKQLDNKRVVAIA